jgi:crotonobetainyl-CoA:carnitine CoA-transferase CaiB-like acyl-CoA transferase
MTPAQSRQNNQAPLQGLRIIDLTSMVLGPYATQILADYGADVIKVEPPQGDLMRKGSASKNAGMSAMYLQLNRNKRSIVLDLRAPADLERALALARHADVIVENFRPGVMDRLGLGYEQLRGDQPALVYCSITGFGSGAGADLPGYDLLVQALGGLMSITGEPDGEPQKVGVALVDVLAGLFATVGILAALRHRDATGEGQLVEVNLLQALLAGLVNQASAYTIAGVVGGRLGNAHPSISPYELYETGDGEVVVAVGNERQFAALCEVIGAPELATDARFATNGDRVANREVLRAELLARLATRPAADWARELTAARVPAGQVNDLRGAFELAQSLGLEPIVQVPAGDERTVPLTRNPIRLSRTPATYRAAPPPLPEH